MSRSIRTALLPFTLLPLLGATTADIRPLVVRVALINHSDANIQLVDAATDRTHEIFRRAGIEISYVTVGPPDVRSDGTGQSAFRIVFSRDRDRLRHVLGAADISSRTAWVLIPNLRETAQETRTSEVTVMAHVVAHELGHLLLGSPQHSVSGLMADPIDFALAEQGGLGFHAEQIKWMQRRLGKQEP